MLIFKRLDEFYIYNILKHSEVIHCIMILSNICLPLKTKRSIVKILETLQDQFLLHNMYMFKTDISISGANCEKWFKHIKI